VRLVVILASVGALYSTAGLTSPALWGIGAPVSQEATNRSFDELARGLANGSISRRKAIKFIAAITLGGILGLSGIGTAFAKNKTCAQWCAAVFGANTPAAGRCTSDAAHRTGLCTSCGTATSPSSVCCTRNSSNKLYQLQWRELLWQRRDLSERQLLCQGQRVWLNLPSRSM
jgi:hypothetical protein